MYDTILSLTLTIKLFISLYLNPDLPDSQINKCGLNLKKTPVMAKFVASDFQLALTHTAGDKLIYFTLCFTSFV